MSIIEIQLQLGVIRGLVPWSEHLQESAYKSVCLEMVVGGLEQLFEQ